MQHVNRAVAVSANVVDCRLVLLIDGLQSLKMLATEKKVLRNVSQYYCKYNSIWGNWGLLHFSVPLSRCTIRPIPLFR